MKAPPRIRARSGQIEEGPDQGKWAFEISLWTFDGETQVGEPLGPYGAFETQAEAIAESKRAAQLACESIEQRLGFEKSGKYIDMKNGGVLRSWQEC